MTAPENFAHYLTTVSSERLVELTEMRVWPTRPFITINSWALASRMTQELLLLIEQEVDRRMAETSCLLDNAVEVG